MINSSIASDDQILCFAYGSNMSGQQMRRRCPSARQLGIAYVEGYSVVFNRKGTYRDGGVASIAPAKPNDRVYGIIWALTAEDMQKLDEIEDPDAYRRTQLPVTLPDGLRLTCYTYIAIPEADYVKPDSDYLDLIIDAAEASGLPSEYVSLLRQFR